MSYLPRLHDKLVGLDIGVVRGKYITILLSRAEASRLTQVWYVSPGDMQAPVGTVKWFGRWRGYAFFPAPATVFEQVCLREIAEFCEEITKLHREARKQARTLTIS